MDFKVSGSCIILAALIFVVVVQVESLMACSFVSVICATSLLPASLPPVPGSLPDSLQLKYLFSPCVSVSCSYRCVCLFLLNKRYVHVDSLSFFACFLSFPSVTLSTFLVGPHSPCLLPQPPVAGEQMSILGGVSCTSHPHTDAAQEEKKGATHAC